MEDSRQREVEKLRTAIEGLEAQRGVLGDAIVEPALESLREKLAVLDAPDQPEITPTEERRIVTILFTDIVGSTSLAEKLDPEDWREVVAEVHGMVGALIQNYNGNVVQYLGDGLLSLFGAYASGERDPENAIRAALDIQNSLVSLKINQPALSRDPEPVEGAADVPIQMRVGIHSGLVVMGDLGSEAKKEFTATGDAMNLAARLQSAAPPGGILISHDTFRFVRGLFDVEPQPPLAIKGKSEPVRTYLVHQAKERPFRTVTRGVAGLETRTVGREAELNQLQAAYLHVVENRAVVWRQVVGEPGIGKSRMLSDMLEFLALRLENFAMLKARAQPGDEKHAFALIRRLWFDRFQIAEDLPLAEAEAKWQERFLKLSGEGSEEAAHALGLLVGLPFTNSPYIRAMRHDPAQVRGRAIVVSRELLAAIRAMMPIVVLFEDLQWADSASWDYLMQLSLEEIAGEQGMFVLATARPEWHPPETLSELPGYLQINLTALHEAECYELVMELLQHVEDVPDYVVQLIVDRSEGVPYFVEEMVNWFLDRGIIDQSHYPWRFDRTRLEEMPLPTTLQHLLLTRLSSLRDDERVTLQRGSIFGRIFWEGGLEALGVRASSQILAQLQPRNFVDVESESILAGEREWSFHQNLLHEVTYESVLKRERKVLHKSAAVWLEAQARRAGRLDEFVGLLGEHTERAGEMTASADWYVRAGERAKERGAPQLARQFFDRALELVPPNDQERLWRVLSGRDEVLGQLSESQARLADDVALLALAQEMGDDNRLAEAYYRQGFYLSNLGDDLAAVKALEAGLLAAKRAGNRAMEALVLGIKVVSLTRLGKITDAAATAKAAITAIQELGDDNIQAKVLTNVAHYYMAIGDMVQAAQTIHQQLDIHRHLGDKLKQASGLANLGYVHVLLGLYEMGISALEGSMQLAETIGARREIAYNRLNLGLAYSRKGDNQAARLVLDRALSDLESVGDVFGKAAGQTYLALALEGSGDVKAAERLFAEAKDLYRGMEAHGYATDALVGLAHCALAQDNLEEARRQVTEVWEYFEQHGTQGMEFPIRAYQVCAEVFASLGESEKLRAAAEAGHRELMQRADKISDLEWRKSFLENVPEHRAILEMRQWLANLPTIKS